MKTSLSQKSVFDMDFHEQIAHMSATKWDKISLEEQAWLSSSESEQVRIKARELSVLHGAQC